ARDAGLPAPALSAEVLRRLSEHPLHGNVRELENLLHRAVALSDGDVLHIDLMGQGMAARPAEGMEPPKAAERPAPAPAPAAPAQAPAAVPADLQSYLDEQERQILVRALQETGFNRTAAAARLGLSLRQIRYRIARLGITTPNGDDAGGLGNDE